jgi:uncharacterized protein YkwD
MIKSILSIILLFSVSLGNSQDLSAWDYQVLEKANTAKKAGYLTADEKKVIQLMNLARIDGGKFLATIAKPYMADMSSNTFTRSLANTLKKTKTLAPLVIDKVLYELALDHAIIMGESGKIGHDNYLKRMKPIQNKYNGLGENCDYGFDDPLTIVMRLLIDEGNPQYGHRVAILNPDFIFVGVSIKPHGKWNFNCVQEFGGKKI